MSSSTEVRDYVIWSKHLHGDAGLAGRIEGLDAGETIELKVDGVRGVWRKMDHGKDGRPTPGIRPLGQAQAFWRDLFKTRRGAVVEIEPVDAVKPRAGALFAALARTEAERHDALQAVLALAGQGWASDGVMDRDAMHER